MSGPVRLVLVIDDEPQLGKLLKMNIEAALPYECVTAANGAEGLALAKARKPDLVLLDIMMPGLNGLETLQQLRALYPDLPVAMLTAVAREDEAQRCLAAGAFDYISKPVDFNSLRTRVFAKVFARPARPDPHAP